MLEGGHTAEGWGGRLAAGATDEGRGRMGAGPRVPGQQGRYRHQGVGPGVLGGHDTVQAWVRPSWE